jgi:hypothetical protein
MNIQDFDILLRNTTIAKRYSFQLLNGNELRIKRIDERSFLAWMVGYKMTPMGQLKYRFNEKGDLEKIHVQVRLPTLLIFAAIPIIIAVIFQYSTHGSIQAVIDLWRLYLGFLGFAMVMQILGLILTRNLLPRQIEELIQQT